MADSINVEVFLDSLFVKYESVIYTASNRELWFEAVRHLSDWFSSQRADDDWQSNLDDMAAVMAVSLCEQDLYLLHTRFRPGIVRVGVWLSKIIAKPNSMNNHEYSSDSVDMTLAGLAIVASRIKLASLNFQGKAAFPPIELLACYMNFKPILDYFTRRQHEVSCEYSGRVYAKTLSHFAGLRERIANDVLGLKYLSPRTV